MKRASTPSFIATFGLRYEPWQRDKLDKLFQVDNNIYNALVKDRKKALGQLESIAQGRELIARTEKVTRYEPQDHAGWEASYQTYETILRHADTETF